MSAFKLPLAKGPWKKPFSRGINSVISSMGGVSPAFSIKFGRFIHSYTGACFDSFGVLGDGGARD